MTKALDLAMFPLHPHFQGFKGSFQLRTTCHAFKLQQS
jgi:hypothetical protein